MMAWTLIAVSASLEGQGRSWLRLLQRKGQHARCSLPAIEAREDGHEGPLLDCFSAKKGNIFSSPCLSPSSGVSCCGAGWTGRVQLEGRCDRKVPWCPHMHSTDEVIEWMDSRFATEQLRATYNRRKVVQNLDAHAGETAWRVRRCGPRAPQMQAENVW